MFSGSSSHNFFRPLGRLCIILKEFAQTRLRICFLFAIFGACGIVEFVFLVRGPGDSSFIKFHLLPICTTFVGFRLESDFVVEKAIGDGPARHDCFTPLTTLLSATLIPGSVREIETACWLFFQFSLELCVVP